jgi:hypothetical protein
MFQNSKLNSLIFSDLPNLIINIPFLNVDALSRKVQLHTRAEKLREESIDSFVNKARTQSGDSGFEPEQDEEWAAHPTIGLSCTEDKSLSTEPIHT